MTTIIIRSVIAFDFNVNDQIRTVVVELVWIFVVMFVNIYPVNLGCVTNYFFYQT